MNITIYEIYKKGKTNRWLFLFDNRIRFRIVKRYSDVLSSLIKDFNLSKDYIKIIKSICKDGKIAILNLNHQVNEIKEITRLVIGNKVIWKKYSLSQWNKIFEGLEEYSSENNLLIEVDHPIDLKEDEELKKYVIEGNLLKNKRINENEKRIKGLKSLY